MTKQTGIFSSTGGTGAGQFRRAAAVAALLGCFAGLAFQSALRESATVDETFNIASGYFAWETGRLPAKPNPPLLLKWFSAPLRITTGLRPFDAEAYTSGPRTSGFKFIYDNTLPADKLLNRCRSANILLGAALAILVFIWTFRLGGYEAAIPALGTFAFMPPLLAHAHLATSDIGNALLSTAAVYFLWRASGAPSARNFLLAGFVCGLAPAGKYTATLLIPVAVICILMEGGGARFKSLAIWSAGAVLGLCLGCWPVSPIEWFMNGLSVSRDLNLGHVTYLLGETGTTGHWYYFPLAFLIKTPLPALLTAALGLFLPKLRSGRGGRETLRYILFPAAAWMLMGVASKTQVGIRHILPVYPLLCIWCGLAAAELWRGGNLLRKTAVCLPAAWLMLGSLRAFPGYIGYFNETAGGSGRGHRFLADSNLDWGQGLKELGIYLKEQKVEHIYLSYFGCSDPHAYGIKYSPVLMTSCVKLPGDGPLPPREGRTLLAVSVTNLLGIYYTPRDLFRWLDKVQPVRIVRDSIWVYDLTDVPGARKMLEYPGLTDPPRR